MDLQLPPGPSATHPPDTTAKIQAVGRNMGVKKLFSITILGVDTYFFAFVELQRTLLYAMGVGEKATRNNGRPKMKERL